MVCIHTAIRRRFVDWRARGDNPRVLTRGSMQGSTPRSRGAWEDGRCWCRRMLWAKHAVQTPDAQLPVRFFKSPHAKPIPPAPRACGVPPCIKPTVKTVGVTTPAYSPRNAAAWRCGLAPTPAPLRAPLPPTTPYHARFRITFFHFSLHNGGGLPKFEWRM